MTTVDALIKTWTRKRDQIVKRMRDLDAAADAGYPDQGGYILAETELPIVKKVIADLRRLARATGTA